MSRLVTLKYGENPHQAAKWETHAQTMLADHPPTLSLNDLRNINTGYSLLRYFRQPVAVVVKHVNIAGMSDGETFTQRWKQAVVTDPRAAMTGMLVVNHLLTSADLREIEQFPFDGVVAPAFETTACKLRLFTIRPSDQSSFAETEPITLYDGTVLLQDRFVSRKRSLDDFQIHGLQQKSPELERDALMAWHLAGSVKTNCAVLVRDGRTLAVAAGHQDGVTAIEHAIYKARHHGGHMSLSGAVLAADGDFPHEIPVAQLTEAGVSHFVLPGLAANERNLVNDFAKTACSVLFAKERCFIH